MKLAVCLCFALTAGLSIAGAETPAARKPAPAGKEPVLDKEIKLGEDEPGCKDSALLPRLPGCSIIQCDTKDNESLEIQVGATQDGVIQKEVMDGSTETIYYLCPSKISPGHITKLAETTLTKGGFKAVYAGKDGDEMPVVTLMKDLQWVQVSTYMYNEYAAYIQTSMKVLPENEANSEALAEEMTKNGRVALYGINFDKEKFDLPADAEKVLENIAAFLVRQPEMKIRVEGHTDNTGDKDANMVLSQKRASAVATWLLEHGIDKARLSIQGMGDTKPLMDNSTDEGRIKNIRIELVKF